MIFGHLIKDNVRNAVIQKSYTKCGIKASPRLFIKNQN